eukprot:s909_g2.t3
MDESLRAVPVSLEEVDLQSNDLSDDMARCVSEVILLLREAYPGAAECVAKMKEAGKPCVILSNYAGRAERQKEKLPRIGFNPNDLAGVVTSGEMAFRYLAKQGKFGKRVLWIAWTELEARGLGDFFEGLEGYTLSESVEEADFILVSGVQSRFAGTAVEDACDYEETGNHRLYRPMFRAAIQRNLPMICANPDLRVIRPGGWKAYLGGSLAAYYERLGGQVIYFGKPYTSAFEEARRQLCHAVADGDEAKALELELDEEFRICHVGDSLHHDVKGAISVGFDAAFVALTGIHAEEMGGDGAELSQVGIRDLCEEEKVPLPQAVVPRFSWNTVTLDLSNLTVSATLAEKTITLEHCRTTLSTDVSVDCSGTYSASETITISKTLDEKDVDPRFTRGPKLTCSTRSRQHEVFKGHCSGQKIVVYAWVEVEAALEFSLQGFRNRQWVASAEVEVSLKARAEVSDANSDDGAPALEGLPSLLAAGAAAVALARKSASVEIFPSAFAASESMSGQNTEESGMLFLHVTHSRPSPKAF